MHRYRQTLCMSAKLGCISRLHGSNTGLVSSRTIYIDFVFYLNNALP